MLRVAQELGPQAGPFSLGPHARCARLLLHTASLTAGPRCQLRLQAPAGRINGATGPTALLPTLATCWSRSPFDGAPLDPLSTRSLLA